MVTLVKFPPEIVPLAAIAAPVYGPARLLKRNALRWISRGEAALLLEARIPAALFWTTLLMMVVPAMLGLMTMAPPVVSLVLVVPWTVKPSTVTPLAPILKEAVTTPPPESKPVRIDSPDPRALLRPSTPACAPFNVSCLKIDTCSGYLPASTVTVCPALAASTAA